MASLQVWTNTVAAQQNLQWYATTPTYMKLIKTADSSIAELLHDDRIIYQPVTTSNKDGYKKWHVASLKHQQGQV